MLMKQWIRRVSLLTMCLVLLCSPALAAGRANVSGICFKYLSNATDDPSASSRVKGSVTAAQVERAILSGAAYGINYKITCTRPGNYGNYQASILLTAPDGWSFPYTSRIRFDRSTEYVWFECLGIEFFQAYYMQYGAIEPGTYTIQLYLNGELEDTSTFTLK